MLNRQLLYLFLLFACCTSAQNDTVFIKRNPSGDIGGDAYITDTVIFNSNINDVILYQSMVLPSTHGSIHTYAQYGLLLENVSKSDCMNHGEEVYNSTDKINSISETDSTLVIDINIYDNCCYEFLCDVDVDESGTMNLIYHGYGSVYCACMCCFGLVYHFRKDDLEDLDQIKAIQINGEPKSLKKL